MSLQGSGDTGELPPSEFIAAALQAGALQAADVVRRGVEVVPVGRSHPVYRVSIGGAAQFYAKVFGRSRGATDGLAARECAVRALAEERPEVAALLPPCWSWEHPDGSDPGWRVVCTAAVAGVEAWTIDQVGGGALSVEQAWRELTTTLLPALARFHRATRSLARPGSDCPEALRSEVPWGLRLMDGDAPPELWAVPALAALLRAAAADPCLVTQLRAARALWRPMAIVHCDLKHDNVIVEDDGGGLRVRVLDWEMARLGDPAWDLATLAARLVAVGGDTPPWPEQNVDVLAESVRIYSMHSGLDARPLSRRVTSYIGAVLLQLAIQSGSAMAPNFDDHEPRLLIMKARATFRGLDSLSAAVGARASAGQ